MTILHCVNGNGSRTSKFIVCKQNIEVEEELRDEETSNCLVHQVLVCRAAVRQFWLQHRTYIKAAILILLAVLYVIYFGFAMSYSFGDEASVRLLWVTCVVLVVMVITKTNHVVRKQVSMTSEPRPITMLRRHSSLINW